MLTLLLHLHPEGLRVVEGFLHLHLHLLWYCQHHTGEVVQQEWCPPHRDLHQVVEEVVLKSLLFP
jgi:hypothetical protein